MIWHEVKEVRRMDGYRIKEVRRIQVRELDSMVIMNIGWNNIRQYKKIDADTLQ